MCNPHRGARLNSCSVYILASLQSNLQPESFLKPFLKTFPKTRTGLCHLQVYLYVRMICFYWSIAAEASLPCLSRAHTWQKWSVVCFVCLPTLITCPDHIHVSQTASATKQGQRKQKWFLQTIAQNVPVAQVWACFNTANTQCLKQIRDEFSSLDIHYTICRPVAFHLLYAVIYSMLILQNSEKHGHNDKYDTTFERCKDKTPHYQVLNRRQIRNIDIKVRALPSVPHQFPHTCTFDRRERSKPITNSTYAIFI